MIKQIINQPDTIDPEWIILKCLDGTSLQAKLDMRHFEIGQVIKIGNVAFLYKSKNLL